MVDPMHWPSQTVNAVVSSQTSAVLGRLMFRARDGVLSPGLTITSSNLPTPRWGPATRRCLPRLERILLFQWTLLPDVTGLLSWFNAEC